MNEPMAAVERAESVRRDAEPIEHGTSVWYLMGQVDPHVAARRIPITPLPFRIGRRRDLSLSIVNQTVSAIHAEIRDAGDGLVIEDLQSMNGTHVNGVPVIGQVPLRENDIVQFADVAFRIRHEATPLGGPTALGDGSDGAAALIHFDKLMDGQAAIAFFQPIVRLDSRQTVGYEAVARSRLYGLKTPGEMFRVAGQLDLQVELSRLFRREGVRAGKQLPEGTNLFINTHPVELARPGLIESLRALRELAPERLLTLEIHEAAVTEAASIRELGTAIRDLRMQLAYDDFGAGQARLVELVEVRPDYLKFDMRLVQGIHAAPARRQQMLATLVEMARGLGIHPLAEGIEDEADGLACQQLGFELGQGYHYGHPAPVARLSEVR